MSRLKAARAASATAMCMSVAQIFGCISVNPKPDYQRTADIVRARTGVAQVFDPETDAEVEQRLEALLVDGLTKDEVIQAALLNNRSFQTAFLSIGVSRAEAVRSGLMSNPSLGLSLRFPEGGGRSNLTLTLAQQLVDLWQIPVRKRIAEAQLERTILTVARLAIELASDAEVRFWQLLALQQAESLAREDAKLGERSEELARGRFMAGQADKLDVNLARAASLETQRRLIALERDIRSARADLARVLGLSRYDRQWSLSGELPRTAAEEFDESRSLKLALTQRLDAQAAVMQIRIAEGDIRREILDIFPNVTLGVEGERTDRRSLPGRNILADATRSSIRGGRLTAPDIQTRSERKLERRQIVDLLLGPTLDITLPIWHQNQPRIARARYEARQRRMEFEDLLDAIAQDVEKAVATARSASALAAFYRDQALPLARENVEAARRAYRAGQQSIVVLMSAQKALIAQRRAYVDARRDYAIALAELRRVIGGTDPLAAPAEPVTTRPSSSPSERNK